MPAFHFEITRGRYAAAGDAPLFAGRVLRTLAERECDPFTIRWRDPESLGGADAINDVLVVEGAGPTPVVTALMAYIQGHDWRSVMSHSGRTEA